MAEETGYDAMRKDIIADDALESDCARKPGFVVAPMTDGKMPSRELIDYAAKIIGEHDDAHDRSGP